MRRISRRSRPHLAGLRWRGFSRRVLAQQRYAKSHRSFRNLLLLKNFRQFCSSQNWRLFSPPILGANTDRILQPRRTASAPACNAFLKCSHPQKLQQLADSLTAHDLSSCAQKWLACLTPFFKESERKNLRLPAPALFLSSRVLRQPHLSPARCTGSIGPETPGCQPHHRPGQQDHHHLRPQGHQVLQGKASNRHRRPRSGQPRRDRLWGQKGRRKPPPN